MQTLKTHILCRSQKEKFVQCIIKQLLDSVFVISRIIKVSVRVISRSRRLRLITPTSTLIILDITKTSSINCLESDSVACENQPLLTLCSPYSKSRGWSLSPEQNGSTPKNSESTRQNSLSLTNNNITEKKKYRHS